VAIDHAGIIDIQFHVEPTAVSQSSLILSSVSLLCSIVFILQLIPTCIEKKT